MLLISDQVETGWKWLKVDESQWKSMKVDTSGWKSMKVDENICGVTCISDAGFILISCCFLGQLLERDDSILLSYILF